MKRNLLISLLVIVLAAACSEPFDLKTRQSDKTYLCVEGVLTNLPTSQTIRLSESIDYQSAEKVPPVTGATVTVSDGTDTFVFSEREGKPGSYDSPKGFRCVFGKTYSLKIECRLSNGTSGTYTATSGMTTDGFDIEKIDYKYLGSIQDSCWVLGVWGKDRPETNYFLISTAVNGNVSPTSSMLERAMLMPDTYFNSSYVSGFPIGYMYQTADQIKKYGACAKPLEKGDIVSLVVYTMTKDYYDFVMALTTSASAVSIPIISSQPANLPTNIKGGDAMGFFAICPVMIASCFVDDPFRTEFKY
jgi:hypothetical protein